MNTTTETTNATQAAAIAAPGAHPAPKNATSAKEATTRKGAPTDKKRAATTASAPAKAPTSPKGARKDTKVASAKAKASKTTKAARRPDTADVPREFSKTAVVLDMLKSKGGATMTELQKATNWQAHSVRGFISGTVGKKMGLAIESTKSNAGERCYRIAGK
jgi:hypothetical protein